MFRHQADHQAPSSAYARWFLVAAGAGCMNAAALVTLGNFVTHVTGFASLFGLHAAKGEGQLALAALAVPFFFMAGAMLAGLLVVEREERGQVAHYDHAMAIAGLCALAPVILARAGFAGAWGGERLSLQAGGSTLIMALLCLSSGIQNAALSAASHRSVRVTHLTGLSTDLGLGLAKLAGGGRNEIKPTLVRLGTLGSFLAGSVLGAFLAMGRGFDAFAVPAAVCFYAAQRGRREKFNRSKP